MRPVSNCGIVILAAGGSTRLGTAKQSLEYQGASLVRRAVATALASLCRPIVVVLGASAVESSKQLESLPIQIVINEKWLGGMGTSIRAGVAVLDDVDAVMILLCDQPLITADALNRLVATHFESGKKITAAFYAQTAGTPVVFDSSLLDELLGLEDSQGGKAILRRYPEDVQHFPLDEAAVDIDTAADFEKLVSGSADDHRMSD